MVLTPTNEFDPETLTHLQAVYDQVYEYLTSDGRFLSQDLRNDIAARIVACAMTGERDPFVLKASSRSIDALAIDTEPSSPRRFGTITDEGLTLKFNAIF